MRENFRRLTAIICLTLAVLFGSAGEGWSAEVSAIELLQKGLDAFNKEDYATALREWKTLAEQGDASGQWCLGMMYRTGKGVPQDDKTAVKWFLLAAKQGHADAQYNLGRMYFKGLGVSQDYSAARNWFLLAAKDKFDQKGQETEKGNVDAQYYLGLMYFKGLGVSQDHSVAGNWFLWASEQGHADAQGKLGLLYLKDPQYYEHAVHWLKLAAEQGISYARECVRKKFKGC